MYIHINDSKQAKQFFASRGIEITKDTAHNAVHLKDTVTGTELVLWAESDMGVAAGIPGIFIDE